MPPAFPSNSDREKTAANVLLGCLPISDGRILIAHDHTGRIASQLKLRGCEVVQWWRMHGEDCPASPWPEGGPFDGACLRLSKDKGAFEMALHAVASLTKPGGKIWVYGANDEGIKSTPKRLTALCSDIKTIETKRHCRVLEGTVEPTSSLRGELSDWRQDVTLEFSTGPVKQLSYPGIFAKGLLDPGTRLLLNSLPAPSPESNVLDYACGSGVIAMGLMAVEPSIRVTLVDADAVAIEAAKKNLPNANALIGSSLASTKDDEGFDIIVANPPYHEGKDRSDTVVQALVAQAPAHLKTGGDLWLVLQNQVNIRSALNKVFSVVEGKSEGAYCVWHARSPHR